jgi:hypothetical protein
MDAADDKGNAYIGYHAILRWRMISLHYYSNIFRYSNGEVKTISGFMRKSQPRFSNNKLSWKHGGFSGEWKSEAKPISDEILKSKEGEISWKCLQPKATAEIKSKELSFKGVGYTERIEITLPVWKLPFKVLYWGRFHSKKHYVVWFKIRGKGMAFCNGKKYSASVNLKQVKFGRLLLVLEKGNVIRKGKLGCTVLKDLPFAGLFPKKPLLFNETKWLGEGKLLNEKGTAIFERVTF